MITKFNISALSEQREKELQPIKSELAKIENKYFAELLKMSASIDNFNAETEYGCNVWRKVTKSYQPIETEIKREDVNGETWVLTTDENKVPTFSRVRAALNGYLDKRDAATKKAKQKADVLEKSIIRLLPAIRAIMSAFDCNVSDACARLGLDAEQSKVAEKLI